MASVVYCKMDLLTVVCLASVLMSIQAVHFHFDRLSCDSLLPQTSPEESVEHRHNEEHQFSTDDVLHRAAQGHGAFSSLKPSNDPLPYSIVTSKSIYRRDRTMTVKLEGPEFNGFIIQARLFSSHRPRSVVAGTFVNSPAGVKTLDCGTETSANTAISQNTNAKRSLELTWKAPSEEVGNVEFVATVVNDTKFWTNIKSTPVVFKEFPPSLKGCGVDKICRRFSPTGEDCTPDNCNYVFISSLNYGEVVFTVGGRIDSNQGYVGVAFLNNKTQSLEICACIKKSADSLEIAQYVANSLEGVPVRKHENLEGKESDFDGDHIWCRFRRPLKLEFPGKSSPDLSQIRTQIFLSGSLNAKTGDPVLGKSSELSSTLWNHTAYSDNWHSVAKSSSTNPTVPLVIMSVVTLLLTTRQLR